MALRALFAAADPHTPITLVVDLHVISERGLARKVLLADLTFEGFLPSMDPQVIVKMAPVVELTATLVTFEWSLTLIYNAIELDTSNSPSIYDQFDAETARGIFSFSLDSPSKKQKISERFNTCGKE